MSSSSRLDRRADLAGRPSYDVHPTISMTSCNIARSLKEFIVEARAINEEFTLMPLSGIGNNLCYAADILNSQEGIEGYYQHAIKFSNINGTMRIRTSLDTDKLKRPGTAFRCYLDNKRFYINKEQLGTQEGLSLGWIYKSTSCIRLLRWNEEATSGNDEQRI
jgi:hypothetical protein